MRFNVSVCKLLATTLCCVPLLSHGQDTATAYPAILAGHAVLPAASFVSPPADAPADFAVSGKFSNGQRTEKIGSVEGMSANRPTGMSLPFEGQPLQGHSGIKHMPDGSFWILTDNGFGTKANSADSMLYLNHYDVDFQTGEFGRLATVFLSDPDKKVPFRIVHEGSKARYLTGADFDPESFQFAGDAIWIGDEFGPYLIKTDLQGRVLNVFDLQVAGKPVRSPDNPAVKLPGWPAEPMSFEVRRSKGLEGMAASSDGSKLYALLEGPLWDAASNDAEQHDGKNVLRMIEFDVQREVWTGRHWLYPLEQPGHAIGDFNMIDATSGLIIERDNGEGTPDKACPAGETGSTCFSDIARFKRVYKVALDDSNLGKPVRKVGYVDLLAIQDPQGLARKPLNDGVLTFPFFTIENVDIVDDTHIVVGNDNNLPFSSSRDPNRADDSELVLLKVGELLQAR
ncbi:glycerophosphodiester phosphodiesterase [Pseudomonas daroniae]|uniref:Glycerophosphodiester phosphodiesterase n=1 Tax=Phytopseudomonas daroniae TaxID=2487519 RepID=A0A4Q9QHE2_9GAMM|nr:glycerophosphodiester phosphodiesterase [Pseudomonas daroniae]TBU85500.1 glycerophosphodiester phosphodiesterase [Pseudomonas sp. FRB 228]TBU94348.1 glycerophosphodiester phosphodiesterase [Pseudomonas daroniae]